MTKHFKNADERVEDDELDDVVAVLTGPSPWKSFIDWDATKKNSPSDRFRIVNEKDFTDVMTRLGEDDVSSTPGVTDKKAGKIFMQEFFGKNSHGSYLGAALHETVHLVSHPQGRASGDHSTAWPHLGRGLLEGFVEMVTEDILNEQKIALADEKKRGHRERVPVARALFGKDLGTLPGRLLFGGEFRPFLMVMNALYSAKGWVEIKALTTDNHPDRAIRRMGELRAAQGSRGAEEADRVLRQFQAGGK